MIRSNKPIDDGFYMPGEFEKHRACIMIWPTREGSWRYKARYAKEAFASIINTIAKSEKVYLIIEKEEETAARQMISGDIEFVHLKTDDAWARDTAPTFLKNHSGDLRAVDWEFNAWGGDFDGLYEDYQNDNALAASFCKHIGVDVYDAKPFVLEGGAIHSDGEGTVIVTEACLLSKGRNPALTKAEIEQKLRAYLGAKKIIWLTNGIYNDETNEHIDNMLAFVKPGEVVLAWTDDTEDIQYQYSKAALDMLEKETDAMGRSIKVHKLLLPKPVLVSEEECQGFVYSKEEEQRFVGERLAASYVNFYISNAHILCPMFGDANDEPARAKLSELFPDREVVGIPAREILLGGGNIHCITQQIPL